MLALAKRFINDLSVKVLEYPEITIPEQGLKNDEQNICAKYKTGIKPNTRC